MLIPIEKFKVANFTHKKALNRLIWPWKIIGVQLK